MENFSFVIKGKTFTTQDLRIGSFIDLWRMKTALSGGTYGQMYRNAMVASDEALMMIDIEAFMTSFCPEFIKSMKPVSFSELSFEDYMEIREVYVEQIMPWLTKVEGMLKKTKSE